MHTQGRYRTMWLLFPWQAAYQHLSAGEGTVAGGTKSGISFASDVLLLLDTTYNTAPQRRGGDMQTQGL